MSLDSLSKVRRLLALACDSDSEEARNAAKAACKLISEGNLLGGVDLSAQVDLAICTLIQEGVLVRAKPGSWSIPSRISIQEVAEGAVEALQAFLDREAKLNEFPKVSIPELITKAVDDEAITSEEVMSFRYYLTKYLKLQVEAGHLISQRGRGFGLFDG